MRSSARSFLGDAKHLYKARVNQEDFYVRSAVQYQREIAESYRSLTGKPFQRQDILVVGAGQTPREVIAFGVNNSVTAIDLDVIPMGWKPGQYVQLLKENGATRTVKTVGRKAIGIDRRLNRKLQTALDDGSPGGAHRRATYLQMDAAKMSFGAGSFDLAYSFSVFEHLPDPAAVLRETIRVLRPGAVLSISVHLYAAEGGCHDLRIFAGDREGIPYWAQLRPKHSHTVIESCYMNKWSLAQWRELFSGLCPGGTETLERHEDPFGTQLIGELATIRDGGELQDYTDDELLAVNYRVVWQKPVTG
jgi:SAM-dependent methyltransferase